MQSFKKEIAGAVAGERAAGAVAAVNGGSEANNKKLRLRIAESWDWFAPVIAILKCAALRAGHGFAKLH